MAAAPAIAASLLPKATAARIPTVRSSGGAVPPPPPPKLARRRNYLRRKLLTTLPNSPPETLTFTHTPADGREIGVREFEAPADSKARDSGHPAAAIPGFDAIEESEASSSNAKRSDFVEGSGIVEASPSGLGRISARTAVKFGAYFVGIFVLQAVVRAILVDSADSSDDKRRRRRSKRDQLEINGDLYPFREKLEVKDGALLYVNEAEMEAKVAEIRMMALEAKERERKNSGDGNLTSEDEEEDSDDEFENDGPRAKSGIEREIDGRLTRVKRGLDSVRENSQVMNVNFLSKSKQEDAEKEKDEEMLMFEKKYRFKNGDSSKPRDKPKGFQGSDQLRRKGSVSRKSNGMPNKALILDMELESSNDPEREAMKISDGNDVEKPMKASIQFQVPKKDSGDESIGMDLKEEIEEDVEQQKGDVKNSTVEQIVGKVTQLRMSETLDSQNIMEEGGKMKISRKHAVPRSNGKLKGGRVGSKPSTARGFSKKLDASSDMWWLKLPYVLAIAMQQGYEEVEERGFYSLKTKPDDDAPSATQASHTVLFEDRGDAHNFSLLLESYFEELEDVRITVVPLPIKELNDAVRSQTKKVIVVRKGQLRLYAGQPLDEVETALRSLLS
ncbi:hypothetical protein V2J09_008689 [Rumex salicifolius]